MAPFESSIAEHYHEETKYTEQGLQEHKYPPLDPAEKPVPFKPYDGDRILLPGAGLPIERRGRQADEYSTSDDPAVLDAPTLSRLLWYTDGCTGIARHPGGIQHFRSAPSAGAMFPTEVYVAVRGCPGLADGIYDYHVLEYSLAPVHMGDVFGRLETASFGHPAASAASAFVILTGEWHRSSWRYKARGYRRVLLDTGHVVGNLVEAAPSEGLVAFALGSFHDGVIEEMLGLDPVCEGPLVLGALVPWETAQRIPRLPVRASGVTEWHKATATLAGRISPRTPEGRIAALHLATRLAADASPVSGLPPSKVPPPEGAIAIDADVGQTQWTDDDPLVDTIARRRSTRRFVPQPVERAPLFRAMSHSVTGSTDRLMAPGLLNTFFVSMNVVGIPPGTYLYDDEDLRLHELSRGQTAAAMLHLGLGQEIFVHAGAAVVHTVDLTRAVHQFGDRAYRLAHLDAGHIGERLNLALLHEGLGVSGCAGFYDDEMNRVLQIPESQAVVYITTLGVPA